jgi:hypothetical protein
VVNVELGEGGGVAGVAEHRAIRLLVLLFLVRGGGGRALKANDFKMSGSQKNNILKDRTKYDIDSLCSDQISFSLITQTECKAKYTRNVKLHSNCEFN